MKTKTKKIFSVFTAMVTVCVSLSLTTVSFAKESYEDNIYMSSFSDYTSDGLPNGWVASKYIVKNVNGVDAEVENTESYAHAKKDGNNNILYIDASAGSMIKDVLPFGKVVSSGKLHISFDHKIPTESYTGKQSSLILALFNMNNPTDYRGTGTLLNNYNPDNLYDFRGTVGHQQSHFVRVPYYNVKDQNGKDVDKDDPSLNIKISDNGALYWTPAVKTDGRIDCNKWYHFDVIVDLDNNIYDVWLDGKMITSSAQGKIRNNGGYNKFKGLSFLQQDGNFKKGTYDNVFVTNYSNEDSVKLVSEYLKGDDTDFTADVAFSEYLDRAPQNGDFVISDSYTGESIDYTVESADGRHAILKINTDKPAKLNIGFNKNSNLKGTISGKLSSKTASVYTNRIIDGSVIPVLDEIKAYDYSGTEVFLNGNQEVPIGTTSINVSFSEPMSFDDAENKIYLQNVDTSERVKLNYSASSDKKSVRIDMAELMSPNNNYKFVVENSLASYDNSNVTLPNTYEVSFATAEGSGFGVFGNSIVTDEVAGTAKFVTSIIKSDDLNYKGTIMICGYKDETVDNVTYTKLEKMSLATYDISDKSITAYETDAIDMNGLDRIRCYVNDMDNQKSILFEEKILTNE